jgi:hypothetical protein
MTTPANPDTSNSVGATDDSSSGGLLNTGSDTILNSINTAIASNAEAAQTAATNSAASASTASTQATNAANSASTASENAGTATTQAGIATTQAGIATNAKNDSVEAKDLAVTAKNDSVDAKDLAVTAKNDSVEAKDLAVTAKNDSVAAKTAAESAQTAAEAAFNSFDDRYLGAKSSDPTVDNDGNALITGALYFNSTDNNIKVYTGSAWTTSYVPSTSFASLSGADFTGAITAPSINLASSTLVNNILDEDNMASNSATALSTQQAIKSYVDTQVATVPVGDITAVTAGTGLSGGGTSGAVTLNIDSTVATLTGTQTLTNKTLGATSVTGNLTFTGTQTVDGRDVSEDGTKLDTIEENATADQTGAEIKTAYESQANTNAYTDTDNAKVNYITVTQAVSLDQMEIDIAALENGMVYKGDWNAGSGSFPGSGSAQTGWFYYVSGAGTVNGIAFAIGDNIVATTDNASTSTYASNWSKHDQTDAVQAVVGLTGSITKSGLLSALNVEDGADQTDTANVTAAGALMDSEVTNLAQVKAFNSSDYATAAQGTLASSALQSGDNVSLLTNNAGYLTSVPAQSFSSLTGKPTTVSGYGITDAFNGAFSSLSGKPTTIAGYGITDAFDGAYGSLTGTPTIPTNNNQLTNGAGYITSVPAQSFSSLTGKPTTIAGYGITDVNSNIDTHLNTSTAATNEVLSWTGSDYDWIAQSSGGISSVVEDTSPQLGGNLDVNGNAITGSTVAINGSAGEFMITATENGPVALRYDNNLKLTTKSDGVDITGELQADSLDIDGDSDITGNLTLGGNLNLGDNDKAVFGSAAELEIYSDGTHSYIQENDASGILRIRATNLHLQNSAGTNYLMGSSGSSVTLYYNGSSKLSTESGGVNVTGTLAATAVTGDGSGLTNLPSGGADLYAANESSPSAQPSATGTNAIAIGDSAAASGLRAMAVGYSSTASGQDSSALGNATASGDSSAAVGFYAESTAAGSVSMGYGAIASGTFAGTFGFNGRASGNSAITLGNSYASGADSLAAAIVNNTSSYGATGTRSVAIGDRAKSAGYGGIAIGQRATASGNYSMALGAGNGVVEATTAEAIAMGTGAYSNLTGKLAFSSGTFGSSLGHAQTGIFVLRRSTTDATPNVLATTASSGNTLNQVVLANNSALSFSGTIIARESAAAGSNYASWEIKGALLRDANAASTVLGNGIQNKLYATAGASAWAIALTADTTNGGLKIEVTGAASTNIRWVATVHTSEVTYA